MDNHFLGVFGTFLLLSFVAGLRAAVMEHKAYVNRTSTFWMICGMNLFILLSAIYVFAQIK